MTKTLTVFLLIFICLNTRIFAEQLPTKLIVVSEDKNAYPWFVGTDEKFDSKNPGTAVELLRIVGEKLHLKIEFKRYPWLRTLDHLKNGSADILMTASYKKKREEFGAYPLKNGKIDTSKFFESSGYILYKRINSRLEWDGQKFKNLTGPIATGIGYSIISKLEKKGAKVIQVNKLSQAFKMLGAKRVEGVAAFPESMMLEISDSKLLTQVERVKYPLVTKPYYFMISHQFIEKYPKLAEKIWDTVVEIRKSKRYKKIKIKYKNK